MSEKDIQFGKSKYGKPFAIGLDVEFNISHSKDLVVCAVDDKSVGIDIEQIRPIDLKVAKRICTDEELIYILGHKPGEKDFKQINDNEVLTRFFEIWTWKEAYGKMMGCGIYGWNTKMAFRMCDVTKFVFENYIVTICVEGKNFIYTKPHNNKSPRGNSP